MNIFFSSIICDKRGFTSKRMGTNVSTFHYLISKLGGCFWCTSLGKKGMNFRHWVTCKTNIFEQFEEHSCNPKDEVNLVNWHI